MGRYSGNLHKLIDSACNSNSKKKWDQVLFYLEGHTVSNARIAKPPIFEESPLAPSMVASVELECELFDQQCSRKGKKEDTPLRIAVKAAPANVIAALCHLGPEASRMVDSRERLPIHMACRRSSDDPQTEKVLIILGKCNPESLLYRDDCGRTPLHWLLWFHAKSRSSNIIRFFCQPMPYDLLLDIRQPHAATNEKYPLPEIPKPNEKEEIPENAAIVHDSCHGAIPLHYAVMQGANKDVLRALIDEYPGCTSVGDRRGRTALSWYLGAGSMMEGKKTNIFGEIADTNVIPWWQNKLSIQLVQLLVSSAAARMIDKDKKRTPLHWACHFLARASTTSCSDASTISRVGPNISNKIFQTILDHNIEAVTSQDYNGETPLLVMFSIVAQSQDIERKSIRNQCYRPKGTNLTIGGPPAFNPSKQLIELLLKCPDTDGQGTKQSFDERGQPLSTAASMENKSGLLPLHTALHVATSSECIQLLIESHPTGLVHTSEVQMQTPLIHAFSSEFSSPLQPLSNLKLLLAAYPTSRHGTYMDGRLAIKMEDAVGRYPIHYACQNQASFEILKLFVEKFNTCATYQNGDGDLPLHSMLSRDNLFSSPKNGKTINGASLVKPPILLTEKEQKWQEEMNKIQKLKMRIMLEPLKLADHLKLPSFCHGMTPLHVAVAFEVVPYDRIFHLLEICPEANRMITSEKGHEYSCIQLHDRLEEETNDLEQWQAIRELLYAFNPLVGSHRKDGVLLDACVKLIRKEITGQGSFHLKELKKLNLMSQENIDLNEALSAINAPIVEINNRSTKRGQKKIVKRTHPHNDKGTTQQHTLNNSSSFASMLANKLVGSEKQTAVKSIYDADLGNKYSISPQTLSPQNSIDVDDEDPNETDGTSVFSGEDEYYSEDDSIADGGIFPDNLGSDTVSQTLSQTLSYVQAGSFVSDKSLLRRAIADKAIDDYKANDDRKIDPPISEEKKEDALSKRSDVENLFELSQVGKRLWCFFVAYNNYKCPEDNYMHQVESILEDLEFDIVEQLIDLAVPDYAVEYMKPGVSHMGLTMRDISCPKVKELFESYYFFLGRFELSSEADGILLHRSCENDTVVIRATEHVVRTTEYQAPKNFSPGLAEEEIWNTGEMVYDEDGFLASEFKDKKKQVCFKFTRSQTVYDNEVRCRSQLGMEEGDTSTYNILPILGHFNSLHNGRYRLDSNDERFKTINLNSGKSICLSDYPYSLVYPHSDEGDLHEYFYHQGVLPQKEIANIGLQVAKALKSMHDKNVIHRNLSMRCVSMLPIDTEVQNPQQIWAVSDFSSACCNFESVYMGAIPRDGTSRFQTGLLPPEMYTKISSAEEDMYRDYWKKVEEMFNVQVDPIIKEPYVDVLTGCSYVIRCHFIVDENERLPELPYKLIQARVTTDLWCLGLLLFTLISRGVPLFPVNIKSGNILDYHDIANWTKDAARAKIYEHIGDPVAQDLLLLLLQPFEDRSNLTMDNIISHPYFSPINNLQDIKKIIAKHSNHSVAFIRKRTKEIIFKSEADWLESRTTRVNCWNFDLMQKFYFSSSEIIGRLIGRENSIPSSFILLPYPLSAKNKKSKLAPTTKKDVERAEKMGVLLLYLAKTLFFGSCVEEVIKNSGKEKKWDATTLLETVSFPSEHFKDLKEEFIQVAADRIEAFRLDPLSAIIKLVERRYSEIRSIFKEARKSLLYIVDEFVGVPLVGVSHTPYPLEISDSKTDEVLSRVLPFMHSLSVVMRCTSGGISGVVRLIFEAAYPHVPPSWSQAGLGLTQVLDEEAVKREILLLHQTLSCLNSSRSRRSLGDDLSSIKSICIKNDNQGNFANLNRVRCADSSLWTSSDGVKLVCDACNNYDFKRAITIHKALETKLKTQEQSIKSLQEQIGRMNWQRNLNLNVPETDSTETKIVEQTTIKTDGADATNFVSSSTSVDTNATKLTSQISVD